MNSLIRRKLVENAYRLKLSHKGFCTGAAAKVSSSNGAQPSNDHVGQQKSSNKSEPHDIAIVGGGMVGMALACSLARMPMTKHLKVAIIDSNPALSNGLSIKKEDPPDARVSTVTPATISLFKDIGAWKYVEQHRHAYFDQMQVWDYTGLGYTRYDARDVHKEYLGCVVENKVLHSSLLSCMQDTDFQKTIYPSRLSSMALNPGILSMGMNSTSSGLNERGNLAKLDLSDGNSLYAKLVVGADGSKSRVRELAGFKTTGWKYSQNAIICTVEHHAENRCAWQRFLPTGPIALLPIGDNFSNIVWTMNPEEATDRKSMVEDDFVKAVNSALDYGFGPHPKSSNFGSGGIFSWFKTDTTICANECFKVPPKVMKLASERMVFPLSLMHANNYVSKHVVLIGDAAHTVHPLAGQGVNLGFGDAFSLSRIISEGIAVGTDISEVNLLKKYEAERKTANVTMMAILDGFQRAYSVDFGPLNVLRAAAFHGAQYIPPLKRSIISYASGDQRLPIFS
ncbi:putative FAD-binding domain, ubiquinone biosynthesis hydroxylase UbiH/COQ6 [Rosa chinensis]|uniref:Ubiquinone biosynthesis monooxygenase COQ6, mitochondrial n=1 Tax=Rosa chinensis TaxID=74649 RepID=A0A2P6P6J9_ROSCH|nr:ubiquinone biosynthesis monooxygenase COQ6, mitochondrial [Rosa chinensis]XP_040367126.1 ubiquinone biosynthesis monooxygenase COQ6, mitochondrial [Rosa chinensis]PRQ17534.1 putative FAD-binding domain, ubiquinone biosynthesis hydroxylase UbiH/COQ6 [Rosa chinensis]